MEDWKPVKGYEAYYEVSDQGRVRSKERSFVMRNGVSRTRKSRIMKQFWSNTVRSSYLRLVLRVDNRIKNKYIHRMVAEAFIPNPEELPCINHIAHDKTNNRVDNLEWVTHSQNTRRMHEHYGGKK